ncbi:hypothetical protein WS7_21564 [Xanthomonas citri pv. malvacearum str. GSPB2388]|nr:hypothetical protein WS7_21564 [Xanthomonas citri pv. malvacearum str. GSPB2388]
MSYGPALLRAGNHSDIATRWEVAGQNLQQERICRGNCKAARVGCGD